MMMSVISLCFKSVMIRCISVHLWASVVRLIPYIFICAALCLCSCSFQKYSNFLTSTPLPEDHSLVIGFQGGRDAWDNSRSGVGKLANKLRSMNLEGVHIETAENAKRSLAIRLIRNAFDRDQNNHLSEDEKSRIKLVLYGMSFGGAAVVKTAKELEKDQIPVLLTVQVDSVGIGDSKIPANVVNAANFFQRSSRYIKGEPVIVPEDPKKTRIIGNFEFDYRNSTIDISNVRWYKKFFRSAHTKMDRDPEVWSQVEKLILKTLEEHTDFH